MSHKESTENPVEVKKNQTVKTLIRLLITVIAFILLVKYGNININAALKHLMKINPGYFFLAYLSYFITILVAGLRFHTASNVLGFQKNRFQCMQLNFVGVFFNNFLPTTFGGDALRGYYLKRGTHISLTKAVACLVCERYVGMVILFWMSSAVFILQDIGLVSKTLWNVPKEFALFSHAGTIASIFLVPFLPQINNVLFGRTNWIYKKFLEPVIVYWHDLKVISRIFILSFFLQLSVVLCHIFIAMSLGLEVPLSYYFVLYPLTTIAGFIIPSLNGLGIREGTYIYFLTKIGINSDQGLAFGMGWLVVLFITSVIGGFIYMFGDFRKNQH